MASSCLSHSPADFVIVANVSDDSGVLQPTLGSVVYLVKTVYVNSDHLLIPTYLKPAAITLSRGKAFRSCWVESSSCTAYENDALKLRELR